MTSRENERKINENDLSHANYVRWGSKCHDWKDEGSTIQFRKD